MKKLFAVVLAVLCLAACKKDDTILYQYTAFGDVSGTNLIADNGVTFHITKLSGTDGYNAQERVLFVCNILKKVSDSEYNIELLDWNRVVRKAYVKSSEVTDDAALGNAPVYLTNAWISGEYLNLAVALTFVRDSETKHIVNLVLDEASSDDNTLCFTLRHNSNGESVGGGSALTFDDVVIGRAYYSFPIKNLIPLGGSKEIKISWEWHITDDKGNFLPETETRTTTGTASSNYKLD